MTTAYTSLLGLALPVTGELSGTWGDTVNTAITSLLDTAVAGTTSITTDSDITLSTTTGASNQARQAIILWNPASGTTTRNITAPAQSKMYTVINASGGTQSIVIRGAGPTTGVTIIKGESALVAWNGSDFVKVSSIGGSATLVDLTVTGNTILGDAAADILTVNATSTFAAPVSFQALVNLPSTGRSAAAALTVTAPAFLYGVASTYTDTTSSGTIAAMAPFYSIARPTLSTSNVTTYTNAATLYIANSPATGGSATITNPFALYVDSGANYFGGSLTLNAGTANGVAYLNGSKVLTTGSALTFDGTFTATGGGVLARFRTGSATDGRIEFAYNTTDTGYINMASASLLDIYARSGVSLAFGANGSEQMRLTSTGLGIGTSSPAVKLEASTTSAGGTAEVLRLSNPGAGANTQAQLKFFTTGTNYGTISGGYGASAPQMTFDLPNATPGVYVWQIASTEQMRFNSTGLGIGVSPANKLSVYAGGIVANFGAYGTGAYDDIELQAYSGYCAVGTRGATPLVFNTARSERMRLSADGTLGIGTTDEYGRLNVQRFVGAPQSTLSIGDFSVPGNSVGIYGRVTSGGIFGISTAGSPIVFYRGGPGSTESMRIDSDGNLEIGAVVSNAKLNIVTGLSGTYGSSGIWLSDNATTSMLMNNISNGVSAMWSSGVLAFGSGNNNFTERARFDSSGNFLVGTTGNLNYSAKLRVQADSNQFAAEFYGGGSNNTSTLVLANDASVGGIATISTNLVFYAGGLTERGRFDNAGQLTTAFSGGSGSVGIRSGTATAAASNFFFFMGTANGVDRFQVRGDGNVYNTNGVYGTLSDLKLKENIIDATPKLNNLMQVRIVNYNLIGDAKKQIGVVAQELEQVFPSMIDELPDRDQEGNDLGTTTKSVKYSVFVPVLIKALQEATTEINSLKARLDAANL